MATPFAAIETRINAAVVSHLANATADFGGGVVVDGIFDADYGDALNLVAGTMPAFAASTATLSGILPGSTVVIGGTSYSVSTVKPDGTGLTRLMLEATD